jgi:transposase
MKTQDARSLPAKAQEALRLRVVKAVRDGLTQTEAARLFGVARGTVNGWMDLWAQQGSLALRARRRGRPPKPRLAQEKVQTAVQLILSRYPDQLRLPFTLWTREAVQLLLARRFGLEVSVWTVGRYLRTWGLTPQKPVRRAYEQNPAAVRQWLEKEYTAIREQARKRHAHILFVDESGFMLAPLLRRTWARRGCTPVVNISEPHGRISVIGAITISSERRHFSFYFQLSADNANFRGESVVQFIELVRHKVRGPITLLWDQIPIHRAEPVTNYFARHRRLVVEAFPPYAPELNPVDNVWSYVKYNRLPNYTGRNLHELRERITPEFYRLQKQPDLLRSFFKHTGLSLDPIYPDE